MRNLRQSRVRRSWLALLAALGFMQAGAFGEGSSIFDDTSAFPVQQPALVAPKPQPAPEPSPALTPKPGRAAVVPPVAAPPVAPPAVDLSQAKYAPPDVASKAKLLKFVKQIYATEYADNTVSSKRKLAGEMVAEADKIKANFVARYVLLQEAETAAVAANDSVDCRNAIEALGKTFAVDTAALTADAMTKLSAPGDDDLIAWASDAVEDRIKNDNYAGAKQILKVASGKLEKCTKAPIRALARNAEATVAEYEHARPAMVRLKSNPADPGANLAVGKFLCFYKNDWRQGLPMLANGTDPKLKSLAQQDLASPAEVSEQYDLAGHWWDAGLDKAHTAMRSGLHERAKYWYEKASPGLSALQKTLAEKRIAEDPANSAPIDAHSIGEIVVEAYIDGNAELHITPDGIYWKELGAAKPGLHDGHNDPTFVNGQPWAPEWNKPKELSGNDETTLLLMPIGRPNFSFAVVAVRDQRRKPGIDARTPVTTKEENGEQIVWIPDPESGAKWYTIRLFRAK